MPETSSQPVIDSTYDIFISYRTSQFAELGEALEARLTKTYNLRVFRDTNGFINGSAYRQQWRGAIRREVDGKLAPGLGPTLVVLATPPGDKEERVRTDPNETDEIVDEIYSALPPFETGSRVNEIPIVVLPFGRDGVEFLRERVSRHSPQEATPSQVSKLVFSELHQRMDPFPEDFARFPDRISEAQWQAICRPILVSVRRYFMQKLKEQQKAAEVWAQKILDQRLSRDKLDVAIRSQKDRREIASAIRALAKSQESRAAVIVSGPGGVGKTALVAQCIIEAIQRHPDTFFPIVMPGVDPTVMDAHLRKALGLHWLDPKDNFTLEDEGLHRFKGQLCFVTDSLERAEDLRVTTKAVESLRGRGKLIATTRPEAWANVRAGLPVDNASVHPLGDLDEGSITELLALNNLSGDQSFLRQIVFTDIALFLKGGQHAKPWSSQSALLLALFNHAITPPQGELNRDNVRNRRMELLKILALQQLESGRFDIQEDRLEKESRHVKEHLDWLFGNNSIVVREKTARGPVLRLRHDVVDSFNIARVVRGNEALLRSSLELLSRGFGQVIGEGVVQAAADCDDLKTIESYFNEFLRLVENKNAAPNLLAAGWNSQSVVTAKLPIFDRAIRSILKGRLAERPPELKAGEAITHLDNNVITQETLSSVGSVLSAAALGSFEDTDGELLNAFVDHIKKAKWRGRLLETLTRLKNHDESFAQFEALCRDDEFIHSDPSLVRYTARAAVGFCELDSSRYKQAMEIIERHKSLIAGMTDRMRPTLLRALDDAELEIETNCDTQMRHRDRTPFSIEEIEEGLSTFDYDNRGDYSDWQQVEKYLTDAAEFIHANGRRDSERDAALLAIGCTLWHVHTRSHERTAVQLGAIDHPFARGLLLHLLTFENVDVTETALIQALSNQGEYLTDRPDARKRFGEAFIRACAARAAYVGEQRAEELIELASALDCDPTALVTAGFVGHRMASNARIEVVDGPLPTIPDWLAPGERDRDVGPELERKLAFVAFDRTKQTILAAPSNWAAPRRAHKALLDRRDFFRDLARELDRKFTMRPADDRKEKNQQCWQARFDTRFRAHVEGAARTYAAFEDTTTAALPGIATLHALIRTSDGYVVEAQRSLHAAYLPGAWATSFEEQFKGEDFETPDPLMSCFQRGLREEFGLSTAVGREAVLALAYGIEWDLQNNCILIAVALSLTSDEFKARASRQLSDKEILRYRCSKEMPLLDNLARSPMGFVRELPSRDIHPTASARLALLAADGV